jgi:hypothetical protein
MTMVAPNPERSEGLLWRATQRKLYSSNADGYIKFTFSLYNVNKNHWLRFFIPQ